jgi:hypothetical protein
VARLDGRATSVDSLMRTSPAFWATLITPCGFAVAHLPAAVRCELEAAVVAGSTSRRRTFVVRAISYHDSAAIKMRSPPHRDPLWLLLKR